jgi:hypothetical protein
MVLCRSLYRFGRSVDQKKCMLAQSLMLNTANMLTRFRKRVQENVCGQFASLTDLPSNLQASCVENTTTTSPPQLEVILTVSEYRKLVSHFQFVVEDSMPSAALT